MSRFTTITIISALTLLPAEASAKPCTCLEELAGLRAGRIDRINQRNAWMKVLDDCMKLASASGKPPANLTEAKARFSQYMGTPNLKEVGGVSLGETKIDPAFEAANCAVVVEATKIHERSHRIFYVTRALPIFIASEQELAEYLVLSEIDARNDQIRFFQQEIAERKKKCGRDVSSDESAGGSGSGAGSANPP